MSFLPSDELKSLKEGKDSPESPRQLTALLSADIVSFLALSPVNYSAIFNVLSAIRQAEALFVDADPTLPANPVSITSLATLRDALLYKLMKYEQSFGQAGALVALDLARFDFMNRVVSVWQYTSMVANGDVFPGTEAYAQEKL